MSTTKVGTATNIYTHIFPPFASQQTLQAGNYEWPFDVVLPGHLPESVLGLPDSYITYTLKAVVERGLLNSNIQAKKLIRIVRTFDPSALELSHTMTVENIWPNKIEYSIVIPQKAIIFGTAIKVRMQFTSLLKGLKIGKVRCSLTETQEFTIPGPTRAMDKYHKTIRDIDNWTFELSEDSYQEVLNDGGADGYVLEESMPLPKKLSECMQDVDTNGLKIRHKVKFNIALHNPDGHISEVRFLQIIRTALANLFHLVESNIASHYLHFTQHANRRRWLPRQSSFIYSSDTGRHWRRCTTTVRRARP